MIAWRVVAGTLLGAALLGGSGAWAQNPTSSAAAGGPNTAYSTTKANAYLQTIATCLARYDARHSAALILSVPGSSDEARIAYAMRSRTSNCMGIQLLPKMMWVNYLGQRGAIAEAIYHRDFPDGIRLQVPVAPLPARAPDKDAEQGRLALDAVGRCVTAANPEAAARLLATDYASDAEAAALKTLGPSLADCMAGGGTLRTTRMTLRGLLAEQLLAMAGGGARDVPASGQGRP